MYRRKRIDPRVIGSFVVGAILLSVGGLIFFGPGGLISETKLYVLHFNSSVKGLTVGSPVRFRGVKIGQVKDISVRVRPTDFKFHIPVVIEIEPSRIEADGSDQGIFKTLKTSAKGRNPIEGLIKKGLRAQLQLDSLVTGRLYVNLDMHPDKPAYLPDYPSKYPAIPTIGSSLGELTKTFEDLPLRELAEKLIRSANGFEKLVTSPSLHNGLAKFDDITTKLNLLLQNLNDQLTPLSTKIQTTLQSAQNTLEHFDSKIDPLSKKLDQSLAAFTAAAQTTEATMQRLQAMTADDSQLRQQLTQTLQELSRASRSVRYLSSEIERDPQILLRGRNGGGRQ